MNALRACLKIARGVAARDFGWGQGGEAGASPQWAVTAAPTPAPATRPAARRVIAAKAVWLRCASVTNRCGYWPVRLAPRVVASRHPALAAKTAPLGIFRQALRKFQFEGENLHRSRRIMLSLSLSGGSQALFGVAQDGLRLMTDHRPLITDHRLLITAPRPRTLNPEPLPSPPRPLITGYCSLITDHPFTPSAPVQILEQPPQ
jgi:hypothetical protein